MLAHFAAHNEHQGYWNKLNERLSTTQTHGYWWHHKFVNLAKKYGLFIFSKKDMRNYYVATIRFHGGIPAYSLPDFFNQMVEPAIQRQNYREVPPKELLSHLIDSAYVDRPVKDFLENSGEMGKTWFEECCLLARHAKENYGEVLPKEEVPEIPLYIFQFFEKYNEGLEGTRYHWRRPFLQVAPYSEESVVILNLPQQAIPMDLFTQGLIWQITWPNLEKPIQIPCQMKRLRQDIVTGEEFFPISATPRKITVSFFSKNGPEEAEEEFRRWTLPLISSDDFPPLIAFREDQRHISNPQTLPAKPLYLMTPISLIIDVDGNGLMTGSFPELVGVWENWKLEAWDLSEALSISLGKDGVSFWDNIPVAKEMAQPELVSGHLFDYQENPDQPLYSSGVPNVQIPIRMGLSKHQALSGWNIHVASLWEAQPNIKRSISLRNFSDEVSIEEDRALFPLNTLLGYKAAGLYDIKVSGPRDLRSEHRIRLWPKFLVKGLSFDFPKPEHAHKDIQFEVHLQPGAHLVNQAGAETVDIIEVDDTYLINAPPEVYRIRLDLVTETPEKKLVRIPVSIPLPRLRWALAEEKIPGDLPFGQDLLNLSISRFEQYQSSALHVQMHGLEDIRHQLKCQLVEAGDGDHILQEATLSPTGFVKDWLRVSLKPFSTTIQQINNLVQFELVYQEDWQSEPIRYPLLSLSPQLDIQSVSIEPLGDISWRLAWEAEKYIKNRRVMIKPIWIPWQHPKEFKIPNEARGELLIREFGLPPSYYEVYFYVMNPWSKDLTEPPEGIEPHIVEFYSPEMRLDELKQPQDGHDGEFKTAIEKACIYDSLRDYEKRDEAVSEATKHLRFLKDVNTLVGSIKWMQNKDIESGFKSFFINNLFHPQIVETMLKKYRPTDPALQEYLRMTAEVTSMHLESAKRLLDASDDPVVMSACLNEIIERKDQDLVKTLVSMMEEGRLSKDDAVTYLLKLKDDRLWVIEEFEELLWSPYTEMLIAAFLDSIFDEIPDKSPDAIKHAMFRATPYEKSQDRIHQYLEDLIRRRSNDIDDVYELLLDRHLAGMLNDKYFLDLISIDPKKSLEVLIEAVEAWEEYQPYIEYIEKKFPGASGVLRPGLLLKTPFGIARIEKVSDQDGKTLQKAQINNKSIILDMVEGEGVEQIRAKIDFGKMAIIFEGVNCAWRCGCCKSFIHPSQHRIHRHYLEDHPHDSMAFGKVQCPIFFTRDDIQYLDQYNS